MAASSAASASPASGWPAASTHALRSSCEGVCWPSSSLDTLDGIQPSRSANVLPFRPVSRLSWRRWLPSASRASWMFECKASRSHKLTVRDSVAPRGVTPEPMLDDRSLIIDRLRAQQLVRVGEAHDVEAAGVEQPVVVVGQPSCVDPVQITDVLAGLSVVLAEPKAVPGVVGEGLRHNAHPLHALARDPERDVQCYPGLHVAQV